MAESGKLVKFTKMQSLGNDYIIVDNRALKFNQKVASVFAKKLCERHFGVGADGVVLFENSETCDSKIQIYAPDGGEVEMSGNGIRCIARYLYDSKIVGKERMRIETKVGIRHPQICGDLVRANLGKPEFDKSKIPVNVKLEDKNRVTLDILGKETVITCLSMGPPQAVVFVDTFDFSVEQVGQAIETNKIFPKRANVAFVQVINKNEISVCSWERGAGITLANGTGAAAAVVASFINGKTSRKVKVHLLGGDLRVEWDDDNGKVYLIGDAKKVFDGAILV